MLLALLTLRCCRRTLPIEVAGALRILLLPLLHGLVMGRDRFVLPRARSLFLLLLVLLVVAVERVARLGVVQLLFPHPACVTVANVMRDIQIRDIELGYAPPLLALLPQRVLEP